MKTERAIRSAAVLLLMAFPAVSQAAAVEPKSLGTSGDWTAYSYQEDGKTICYMTTSATKAEPSSVARKDVMVLVTHRPANKSFDVVSFMAGTPLKKDVEPKVAVDNDHRFTLFVDGGTAWARDSQTDKQIVEAMRAGKTVVLNAEAEKGGKVLDTFSLKGVSAAHTAIDKACGVKK